MRLPRIRVQGSRPAAILILSFPLRTPNTLLADTILNLLFPCDCVVCSEPAPEWCLGPLCRKCFRAFELPKAPLCGRCGDPLDAAGKCTVCPGGLRAVDMARFSLVLDENLREAIHQFKYAGRTSLSRPLGRCLAATLGENPFRAGIVVPVPLHRTRERQRGFNQARLLAERLGLALGTGLVRRRRATETQTGLTRRQRSGNVRNAFECRRPVSGAFLIVDDVMTTGATLNEVARALRKGGASRIEVLTLTRATIATRPACPPPGLRDPR